MRFLIIFVNIVFLLSSFKGLEAGERTRKAELEHQKFVDAVERYYSTNKRIPILVFRNHRSHFPKEKAIAIVGLGPAGLLAAVEAYRNGLTHIFAVEKRDVKEYSRDNILRLGEDHFKYIQSLFDNGDKNNPFQKALRDGRIAKYSQGPGLEPLFQEGETFYAISTKDLEVLLSGLLLQLKLSDPNRSLYILRGYEFVLVTDGNIYIKPKWEGDNLALRVDEIIDASGAKGVVRSFSDIESSPQSSTGYYSVFSFFMPEEGIPDETIPAIVKTGGKIHQAYHPKYAESDRLRLKEIKHGAPRKNLYQEISLLNPIDKEANQTPLLNTAYASEKVKNKRWPGLEMQFIKLGLKEDYKYAVKEFQWEPPGKFKRLPITRFFINKNLVYIGSEMPKTLYDMVSKQTERRDKKKLLERWAKFNLRQHLPEKIIDRLRMKRFSYFKTELRSGDKPVSFVDGIRVTTLGDSWVTPHFFAGSGIGSAIGAVREWSKFLRKPDKEAVFLHKMERIKESTLNKPFKDLQKYDIIKPQ